MSTHHLPLHRRKARVASGPRRQAGIAFLEFALIAPILILLLIGVVQLGSAFYTNNALLKALGDGAIYASANVIHNNTGVVDDPLHQATITSVQNLVVYGNPGGTGSPLIPGLTTSNVTLTRVNSVTVQLNITGFLFTPMFSNNCLVSTPFGSLDLCVSWQSNLQVRAL